VHFLNKFAVEDVEPGIIDFLSSFCFCKVIELLRVIPGFCVKLSLDKPRFSQVGF
jgi:hypothetical protein